MPSPNGERTLHEWMRHLDSKIDASRVAVERRLVIIDNKLDHKAGVEETACNRARLDDLESFANKAKGVAAFLSLIIGILGSVLLMGCAHAHVRTYFPTGELQCDSVTTVVGRGDVEVLVESDECPDTIYESRDTGLSDNGVEAINKVAEGVAAGVVKGIKP